MLRQEIQGQMKRAMKERAVVRLEALRFVWSEIRNVEIDKKAELDDDEILTIIRRERKKREEGIDYLKQMERSEQAAAEEAKLAVLMEFVEEMSRDQIEAIVNEVVDSGGSEFGAVMGKVMGLTQGKADGKVVSEVVREKLQERNQD